jgi:glyoxylase-like metal-dependent hydrolase (beta-lactamase superfamily II)
MVSAYLLLRGDEAVLVDTGTDDSGVDDIEAALTAAGGRWDGVRHVVLTHHHFDHIGGLDEVLRRATRAEIAVGEPDVEAVRAARNPDRRITPVRDRDEIFGLRVVATPGHTPGHISVLDPESRVLVVGDAMTNEGALSGANPAYSDDLPRAVDSVRALAGMDLDTLLFGHGDPMTDGVNEALDRLLPTLT